MTLSAGVPLYPRTTSLPAHGSAFVIAAAIFAAGLVVGATVIAGRALLPAENGQRIVPQPPLRAGYPAIVLYVNDGDTFEAKVKVWPGMEITTKVRLRTVDAPEMKYRCEAERSKAYAAREALATMLRQGNVTITNVQQDRYGGRVDADVTTAGTPNVADVLVAKGLARPYDGGQRESWCDG